MLNRTQENALAAYFEFPADDLANLTNFANAEEVFSAFILLLQIRLGHSDLSAEDVHEYAQSKLLGEDSGTVESFRQLCEIVRHPSPQNRSTGSSHAGLNGGYVTYYDQKGLRVQELEGLLGLTALDDGILAPVTKLDVLLELKRLAQAKRAELQHRRPAGHDRTLYGRAPASTNAEQIVATSSDLLKKIESRGRKKEEEILALQDFLAGFNATRGDAAQPKEAETDDEPPPTGITDPHSEHKRVHSVDPGSTCAAEDARARGISAGEFRSHCARILAALEEPAAKQKLEKLPVCLYLLRELKARPRIAEVQAQGWGTLSKLAQQSEQWRSQARKQACGLRHVAVAALEANREVVEVVKAIFGAVRDLALDDFSAVELAADCGIDAIAAAMRSHPGHAGVQLAGCQALWNLATEAVNKEKMVQGSGLQAVLHALLGHQEAARVQEAGCMALCHLAQPEGNKLGIAAAGGVRAVLGSMQAQAGVARVQLPACRVLQCLAADEGIAEQIMADGGASAVVQAMRCANACVQLAGCRVLWNLASWSCCKIVADGGVGAVVAAMVQFPGHAQLQTAGLQNLQKMASSCVSSRKRALHDGGVAAVVCALDAHVGTAELQTAGCQALCNLAIDGDLEGAFVDSGGIEAVLAAMRAHLGHTAVQLAGCRALCNLAGKPHNQTQVVNAGGTRAVVAAMRSQCSDCGARHASIHEAGCHALSCMARSDDDKRRIVSDGGADVIQLALETHKGHQGVQEAGSVALSYLIDHILPAAVLEPVPETLAPTSSPKKSPLPQPQVSVQRDAIEHPRQSELPPQPQCGCAYGSGDTAVLRDRSYVVGVALRVLIRAPFTNEKDKQIK
ncbi:hypothetical protein CYMTET_13779 [Cymbomonas tetramitiformis]|uniref:LRRK2 ARM repeat domain-containing protein n=1 Tax=Cymbomonas tetramitiformis TaxID=36881 RepID=A0AAE0GHY2_9CHLO|nr:hypothetical protein CYMTET_13779 [Cymbomonas tetramitiformis]